MTAHCATCSCGVGEDIPRPATSSKWARRQALDAAKAAVLACREKTQQPPNPGPQEQRAAHTASPAPHPPMEASMTTPDLSEEERRTVERFEAANAAPESAVESLARVLAGEWESLSPVSEDDWLVYFDEIERDDFRRLAVAALAAMRGIS